MKSRGWIVVAYDLPNEPSKARVKAWRALKRMGAVYPSLSLCLLPDSGEIRDGLVKLKFSIQSEGQVMVLRAVPLGSDDERNLVQLFRRDRMNQFRELVEECQEFLEEVRSNMEGKNITYEEADELESSLESLERWYLEIKGRGFADPRSQRKVENLLRECRKALSRFEESAQPRKLNEPSPL